jgi:hypothetical protein
MQFVKPTSLLLSRLSERRRPRIFTSRWGEQAEEGRRGAGKMWLVSRAGMVPSCIYRYTQDQKIGQAMDIGVALRLPETGLKAELLQWIVQFFDGQPELKKNQQYEGLFNPPPTHLENAFCVIVWDFPYCHP